MRTFSRAALVVASFFCLLGTATIAAPSFAAEGTAPTGTATAMLAAVTAPLLAVDIRSLEASNPDFSTTGHAEGTTAAQPVDTDTADMLTPESLDDLVIQNVASSTGDKEGDCLATSVYFEAKGEPLDGQLAVAQTIVNRTNSGHFPSSICGVVRQPGQFSFMRRSGMPKAPRASAAWQRAVAVARIAREGLWKQIAPEALFFHTRSVSPGWGKTKVASLGNHIFFR